MEIPVVDGNAPVTPRKIRFLDDGSSKGSISSRKAALSSKESATITLVSSRSNDAQDEVIPLRSRISELEEIVSKQSILIESLEQQKKEFDLLRQQSSKGFKSLRILDDNNNGGSPNSARALTSGRSPNTARGGRSGKELAFAAKSPQASSSGKGLPPIINPNEGGDKDEIIRDQAAQIDRLNEKLAATQSRLQSLQETAAASAAQNTSRNFQPNRQAEQDAVVASLEEQLSIANATIAKLETQNQELLLQQEQFKLLRLQSTASFKLARVNNNNSSNNNAKAGTSMKIATVDD